MTQLLYFYGQSLVELVENGSDCKIVYGGYIGFKLSHIFRNGVAKTLENRKNV